MATPNRRAVLTITFRDEQIPAASRLSLDRNVYLAQVEAFIGAMASGAAQGTLSITTSDDDAVAATGTLTLSGASGSVAGVVNGVSFPVDATAAGSDTAAATALAAAINASDNALVADVVTASSALGVVTVTADTAGTVGNLITLAASGTGITASGNRLTGGAAGGNLTTASIEV